MGEMVRRAASTRRRNHYHWLWGALAILAVLWGLVVVINRTDEDLSEKHGAASEAATRHRSVASTVTQRVVSPAHAQEVFGRVTAAGEPVEGARVCALCSACDISLATRGNCTNSNATGEFSLFDLGADAVIVTASLAGYQLGRAQHGKPISMTQAQRLDVGDIPLVTGGQRFAGKVLDATGGPIEGATVQVAKAEYSVRPLVEVTTDSSGQFSVGVEGTGTFALRADAAGYSPNMIHRAPPSEDATIVLAPGATISGKVVLNGTDEPVTGVDVVAMGTMGATLLPPARSNDDGLFTLNGVAPGKYRLVGEGANVRGSSLGVISVGLGDSISDVAVHVSKGALVRGRVVVDDSGAPCEEGYVALGPWSPFVLASRLGETPVEPASEHVVPAVRAPIEPSGQVLLKGLPRGRYFVRLECRGQAYASGPTVIDVAESDLDVTWGVSDGLGLRVQVRDARGRPIPHARVSLELPRRMNSGSSYQNLRIDEAGDGLVEGGLYPGRYRVIPDERYGAEPVPVELQQGDGTVDVTVVVPGEASLVVRVYAANGAPLDSVQVVARRVAGPPESDETSSATNDEGSRNGGVDHQGTAQGSGSYLIRPLEAGNYLVEVRQGANPPHRAQASSGSPTLELQAGQEHSLDVTLDCTTPLSGVVVDEAGAPLPDAWVTASFRGEPNDDDRAAQAFAHPPTRVLTDETGQFMLDDLCADATYRVQASLDRGALGVLDNAVPGEQARVVARWNGGLEGRVVTSDGVPVADCFVSIVHQATGQSRSVRVQSTDGRFALEDLPSGPNTISVHGDGISGHSSVTIPQAETLRDTRIVVHATEATDDGS